MVDNTNSTVTSAAIPFLKLRVALAVFAVASVFLPIAVVKTFSVSIGVSLYDFAGTLAYLIPLTFIAALITACHPPLKQHSKLVDKIGDGVLLFFLVWGIWKVFQAVWHMMELNNQIKGIAGQSFSIGGIFDYFTPGIGIVAVVGTYILGGILYVKRRKLASKNG